MRAAEQVCKKSDAARPAPIRQTGLTSGRGAPYTKLYAWRLDDNANYSAFRSGFLELVRSRGRAVPNNVPALLTRYRQDFPEQQ